MNLYVAEEMGNGGVYKAPDPHFINSIALFSSNLPWDKFQRFFETKRLVNLSGSEQLVLLRLLAIQELLCLDDDSLLKWAKNQLYLFAFMQADFEPRIPTKKLLADFRNKFDQIGLLKPFRRQCERLIRENESRFPQLDIVPDTVSFDGVTSSKKSKKVDDIKVDLLNVNNNAETSCPNCGSENVIKLSPDQEGSTIPPDMHFSRCRFCGNTFRD